MYGMECVPMYTELTPLATGRWVCMYAGGIHGLLGVVLLQCYTGRFPPPPSKEEDKRRWRQEYVGAT